MTYKRLLMWGILVVIVCTAGGAAVYLPARAVPSISEQVPPDQGHVQVQIVSPRPGSRWPLNAFMPIMVQAQAPGPLQGVEVFINGTPLESQHAISDSFSSVWMWQPGVEGDFVLTARATGRSGFASVSDPVLIHAMPAGNTLTPVSVQAGDTLLTIAERKSIPVAEMQSSNPNIDPGLPLKEGQQVFVPNAPGPVINKQIIEPLSSGGESNAGGSSGGASESQQNAPPSAPGSDEPQLSGPSTNFWNDLNFLLKTNPVLPLGNTSGPKYPPNTPQLWGDFEGCTVTLRVGGAPFEDRDPKAGYMGWEDDGFFVYRSRDGGPSERIHTLPPVHDLGVSETGPVFTAENEYGTLTYHVSAFNALGEVASNPVTFTLNPGTCSPPGGGGAGAILMDSNGDLVLPYQMDTAYLYLQINGSVAVRVPEGDRMFLPGSGIRFNLYDYLGTLSDAVQAPDLKLHMEVWGWQAGNLVFVGPFDTELHRTVLTICSVPGEGACSGGGGTWVSSLNLPLDPPLKDLMYEMRWQVTSLTAAQNFILRVSESGSPYDTDLGLIFAGSLDKWVVNGKYLNTKGNEGIFPLELGSMLYPDPPPTPLGWDSTPSRRTEFRTRGLLERPAGEPFTLYVQVFPHLGMDGYEHETNIVSLFYDTSAQPSGMPPLASPYPSLYDLEILGDKFKPASHYKPDYAEADLWGCVVIDEDPTGQYQVGQVVCPGKDAAYAYYHQDDCADKVLSLCLLEGLANSLGFIYDQFKLGYDMYKDYIAQGLSAIIPGCSDSPDCQLVVHKAVDYVAAYVTGLPADLPSSNELIADSIASEIVTLVEQAEKSYTGLDESFLGTLCEEALDCKEKLSEAIQTELKQAKSIASQPACTDSYNAYFHGQAPACLDPRIIVHPAPGSIESPAVALVRVTRKTTPESVAAFENGQLNHSVFVTVTADSAGSPPNHVDPFLKMGQIGMPPLAPGQSLVLPAMLESFWLEDDFSGGVAHIEAVEKCYSPNSTWDWVVCKDGGSDTYDLPLP